MRRVSTLLIACVGFALAACTPPAVDQSKTESTASPAPPVSTPGASSAVQPGMWRTTVTVLDMTAPGVPPAAIAQMKAKPLVVDECNTAEDMKDFAGKHALEDGDSASCTVNTINAAAGAISGQATCKDNDGVEHTSVVEGTFTSTHVDMTMTVSGATPAGPMSQKMHLVSDRTGECKAG